MRLLWTVAATLLLFAFEPLLADERGEREQRQLEGIQAKIKSVQKSLAALESEKSALSDELGELEKRYGRAASALRDIEGRIQDNRGGRRRIDAERRNLVRQVDQQRGALTQQVRASHAMGRQEGLKLLLNQRDPARVSRILAYYGYLNRARLARVHSISEDVDELVRVEQELSSQALRLIQLYDEKKSEQQALVGMRAAREKVLARLNNRQRDQGDLLRRLQADEKQLQRLIASIQQALDPFPFDVGPGKTFPELRGRLGWPVQGRISKGFGAARVAGRWEGVLIDAPEGELVRAVFRGRIVYADWLRGYGLLAILDHGDGYMTLYAFNQSLFKAVGEWVDAGEAIAAVGYSGGRSQAGLYFEIRKKGKPVNPVHWCRKVRKGAVG